MPSSHQWGSDCTSFKEPTTTIGYSRPCDGNFWSGVLSRSSRRTWWLARPSFVAEIGYGRRDSGDPISRTTLFGFYQTHQTISWNLHGFYSGTYSGTFSSTSTCFCGTSESIQGSLTLVGWDSEMDVGLIAHETLRCWTRSSRRRRRFLHQCRGLRCMVSCMVDPFVLSSPVLELRESCSRGFEEEENMQYNTTTAIITWRWRRYPTMPEKRFVCYTSTTTSWRSRKTTRRNDLWRKLRTCRRWTLRTLQPRWMTWRTETMDGDFKRTDKKRDGPETRTVVLAPEKKRQRNYFLEIDKAMDYMKEYLYYQNRNCWIKMDFPMSWRNDHNLVIEHQKTMLAHYYEEKRKSLPVLFNIDYKHDGNALACLRTARIYKVDDETSNIDEFNLDPSIWNEVDKADEAEIRQFAEEKAFQKVHRLQITSDMVQVDGVWIRKRKDTPMERWRWNQGCVPVVALTSRRHSWLRGPRRLRSFPKGWQCLQLPGKVYA